MISLVPRSASHSLPLFASLFPFLIPAIQAFGACFLPMLDGRFDFINGLYYSYLCFTAIEYGKLIPEK